MKFLVDENIPKASSLLLREFKHEVIDVRGTDEEGLSDSDIFQLAQNLNAIFITSDKDFFHTIPFLFQSHHGIIVIALNQPNRINITQKLKWVLDNIDLDTIKNKVILLRDNSYTISNPD